MEQKKLFLTVLFLASSTIPCSAKHAGVTDEWSFSRWFSEGFHNIMHRIERDVTKLKREVAKLNLLGPKITRRVDKQKNIIFLDIELPGYDEEDIKVTIEVKGKVKKLFVKANKDEAATKTTPVVMHVTSSIKTPSLVKKQTSTSEGEAFLLKEKLPKNVIEDQAAWTYEKGILRIELPFKKKSSKKRNIVKIRRRR